MENGEELGEEMERWESFWRFLKLIMLGICYIYFTLAFLRHRGLSLLLVARSLSFHSLVSNNNMSILSHSPLSGFPADTPSPFLFLVYHSDNYPAGNSKMEAPIRGNGAHFDPSAPYRMYHGDKIPGFPQHPHRGFETITATMSGIIDHADSHGNAGRYGSGDLQWMTAGSGVVHGEMFPLVNQDKNNKNRFFQIWLNLPKKDKMTPPKFAMHWAEDVVKHTNDSGAKLTLFAGQFNGLTALSPTPASWASNPDNDVGIFHITLPLPNATITIPPSAKSSVNRALYCIETRQAPASASASASKASASAGSSYSVDGESFSSTKMFTLDAKMPTTITSLGGGGSVEFLVLQGRSIDEPIAKHGPFVMNTQEEIQQA